MTEDELIYKDDIKSAMEKAGIPADDISAGKLSVYMAGILEKNEHINLTRITGKEDFIKEHYVDSASLLRLEEYKAAKNVCDVGTGAGFPGIVLAVLSPDKTITLIDSLAKRLAVIRELADKAGIDNIILIHSRAEDAGHDASLRESFDLVTARAVAKLSVLAELCVPLVKKGGVFAAFKGASCEEEVKDAKHAANILGVPEIVIQDAGVSDTKHAFAVMKKTGKTPVKYPRKAGVPAKKPL